MLKAGRVILMSWGALNALPGIASLIYIFLDKHAPGLRMLFSVDEIQMLDARTLAMVDGLATIANSLIVVYCVLFFFIVLKCFRDAKRWAFFVLLTTATAMQLVSYLVDNLFFMGQNFHIVNASTLILFAGFALCAAELFIRSPIKR